MSNTNNNRVTNYRPVSATMTVEFESNLTNDSLRSPTFWTRKIANIPGIRGVKISLPRDKVRVARKTS